MKLNLTRLVRRDDAKPTLRQRANTLRAKAARVMQPDLHLAFRDRLLTAFAEMHDARPITNVADTFGIEDRASYFVSWRMWNLADEVLALPEPRSVQGLGVVALAQAMHLEGSIDPHSEHDGRNSVAVVRAMLAVAGEPLPAGFLGFGDEPDFRERERAALGRTGSLPAWAVEKAQAEAPYEPQHFSAPESTLTRPVIGGFPRAGCPASQIGQRIGDTFDEYAHLDEANGAAEPTHRMRVLEGQSDEMLDALSYARAASFAGMLAQVAAARSLLDRACNCTDRRDRETSEAAVIRCLHSVAAAICSASDLDRDSYGAGSLHPSAGDALAALSDKAH